MKTFVVIVAVCVLVGLACAKPADKYSTKFDNVDLDKILDSDRLLSNYVNCLLDKGKCTADGTELKNTIHDALETSCEKCSEKQKEGIKKVVQYLLKNKRDLWNELEAKYDPGKTYVKKYEAELKAEGIVL